MRLSLDVCPPTLYQVALTDFLAEGHFARHLRRMRTTYETSRDALFGSLARHTPGLLTVAAAGVGAGMHLVGFLPDGVDDRKVVQLAAERGVGVSALSSCYTGPPRPGLLLGFGAAREKTRPTTQSVPSPPPSARSSSVGPVTDPALASVGARARAAAGALFLDEDDLVLMVVPSYRDVLEIPGGGVEPGESPHAAARRAVREEHRSFVVGAWSPSRAEAMPATRRGLEPCPVSPRLPPGGDPLPGLLVDTGRDPSGPRAQQPQPGDEEQHGADATAVEVARLGVRPAPIVDLAVAAPPRVARLSTPSTALPSWPSWSNKRRTCSPTPTASRSSCSMPAG